MSVQQGKVHVHYATHAWIVLPPEKVLGQALGGGCAWMFLAMNRTPFKAVLPQKGAR